jgi:ferrochelatase
MRYWHPRSDEAARAVRDYDPDEVVLLPLYPQYSTTTTASSLEDWRAAAARVSLAKPTWAACCYSDQAGFVAEIAERLDSTLEEAAKAGRPRVLFSAHGLPERVVAAGDPYQWQVERTAAAIVEALTARRGTGDPPDWLVCYQSRVGRLKWIEPYTDAEIARAGRDRVPLVVVPIAFVSEHSETLVELDVEYRHLADEAGVPLYLRVGTVDTGASFIAGLADVVVGLLKGDPRICSASGGRICPSQRTACALAAGGKSP